MHFPQEAMEETEGQREENPVESVKGVESNLMLFLRGGNGDQDEANLAESET
jgi:hypothetical protein